MYDLFGINSFTGYNELYKMFKFHGYHLKPTIKNLNVMLNLLKKDYPFLNEVESPRSRFLGVIILINCYIFV